MILTLCLEKLFKTININKIDETMIVGLFSLQNIFLSGRWFPCDWLFSRLHQFWHVGKAISYSYTWGRLWFARGCEDIAAIWAGVVSSSTTNLHQTTCEPLTGHPVHYLLCMPHWETCFWRGDPTIILQEGGFCLAIILLNFLPAQSRSMNWNSFQVAVQDADKVVFS